MDKIKKTTIEINIDDVIKVINDSCLSCIGIHSIVTNEDIVSTFMKGKIDKGIKIDLNSDNSLSIDVHLVMTKGIKVTESLRECQKRLRYVLTKTYNLKIKEINLFADSLNLSK